MLSGVERPNLFQTTPFYLSSGTVVSNVKVLALELPESFGSLQLTLDQFVRSQVLSREEWQIYHRTVGGFVRTYTEQQAVGREELDT